MQGFVIRTLITMLGLYLASLLVPGVQIHGAWSFIFAAVLLGIVNGFVRPIAFLMTLPLTIITLGLFLLVINAAMFGLVSITSTIASWYIGPNGQIQVYVVRR